MYQWIGCSIINFHKRLSCGSHEVFVSLDINILIYSRSSFQYSNIIIVFVISIDHVGSLNKILVFFMILFIKAKPCVCARTCVLYFLKFMDVILCRWLTTSILQQGRHVVFEYQLDLNTLV